ncbi:MAG TPA: hypothetical protein VE944_06540 [Nostoc sp.]|uniref:hypothetical protein n=1 Tax=Nostoc sp. TaxID=1180 RepID=UPI002D72AD68|nr:hypothetical protein [Nostoc sp.]HYX14014.1 hypothetical protein [Nostoc sp.]
MTISLFSGDAGRSFLIQRGMDSYGEVSRRQEAEGRGLQYSFGCFSIEKTAREQLVKTKNMPVCGNLAPEVADKINNLVGLNTANLQLATYEVFHVGS